MIRHRVVARLVLLVVVAGLLPIALVGLLGIQQLERRSARDAQEALHEIARQAAARIGAYVDHQRELLRAIGGMAAGPEVERRLAQVALDAPSLRRVWRIGAAQPAGTELTASQLQQVLAGEEVLAQPYFLADSTPAMDLCVPIAGEPRGGVCAQIDLLELWRLVQQIHVGKTGYALALDRDGALLASGLGALRPAVLERKPVFESRLVSGAESPTRFHDVNGRPVLAGVVRLPSLGWTVVVEEPEHEALSAAHTGQWVLLSVLALALLGSFVFGRQQALRVLQALEIEERWRTAGRIASGISHDLGHRLRILQQTAALAEDANPLFLPRIRDNLRSEVATLKRFVAEFADLSRDMGTIEPLPLELGAFLESVRRTAAVHAEAAGVTVRVQAVTAWVRADRHLLERATLNLLMNAIEASASGAEVQLSVRSEGRVAAIDVADRGAGIAPERLSRLFDAFSSTKRTGAHVGMGLANVKRIVDAHRGSVRVKSELGQGTVFSIELERIEAPAGERSA